MEQRKRGRPPGTPTPHKITVRLTLEQAQWVEECAAKRGETAPAFVRGLVAEAMEEA